LVKTPKQQDEPEDKAVIMERMEQALKRGLSTPHVTNEELVKRRRGEQGLARRRKEER
jgi:hypothetical protein